MGDYNIDINVNMGSGGNSNFQSLIDAVNNLTANFQKVGAASDEAGNKTKKSFTDSALVITKYGGSLEALTANIQKIQQKLREHAADINKVKERYNQGIIDIKKYSEEIRKINNEFAKKERQLKILVAAQKQYSSALGLTSGKIKGVGTATKAASTSVNGLSASFNKLGAVLGISFGLYGLFRVIQGGIKTISEFDLAQKKLRSILGETAEGMEIMSKSAISLGRASIFGAKGVSELQIELAKMGFTKQQIMDMQQAIVNLATATQEDLASSAEVVANILRAYGLEAIEATRITDVMGKSFNDSALDLSNFREAIKYVAPVARQAGFSFEETVAALELLANSGLKGSLAGTGLNNVLKAMMDSNSKLSKSLGGTVYGFEGFRSVLQKAKDEGWSMEKIFGVITQRATAAFTIFKNGTKELDRFREANMNAAGTMERQTAVQLESIAYQAKLAKESFKALWLEMDKGDGVLSKSLKGWMLLSRMMTTTSSMHDDMLVNVRDAQTTSAKYLKFIADMNLGDEIRRQVQESVNGFDEFEVKLLQKNNAWYVSHEAQMLQRLEKTSSVFNTVIEAQAKKTAMYYDIFFEKTGDSSKAHAEFIDAITKKMDGLKESDLMWQSYSRALQLVNERLSKNTTTTDENTSANDKLKKAIQERYKYLLEMLKLEKEIEDEKIKNQLKSYEQQFTLQTNAYTYNVQRAKLELELALALGEDEVKAKNIYNLELELAAMEHSNKMVAIRREMNEKLAKEEEKLLKGTMKPRNDASKDYNKDWKKRMEDLDDFMQDFNFKNPILGKLFGQQIDEGLFSGLISEEDATQFAQAFNNAFDSIGENLNGYVDSWVEATDRIVDQLNRQVDETQNALEAEMQLMAAGYANNVTLKRKELEDMKKLREKALQDQRKAQQAQAAIETITQISSLVTAAAQIFKSFSAAFPIVGVPLAIGVIAAMFGAFAAAKAKAIQTAGISKYEKGGWIGGKRHSDGGTVIEAEQGEYMVNRKSATKHKDLIEAINRDDKIELNRLYLNKMRDNIITARVSLDDSKELQAIRALLEKNGKHVEYTNEYRIERIGNTTTKIRLN